MTPLSSRTCYSGWFSLWWCNLTPQAFITRVAINEAPRNFGAPFRLLDCEDRTPSLVLDRYAMENRPRSWYQVEGALIFCRIHPIYRFPSERRPSTISNPNSASPRSLNMRQSTIVVGCDAWRVVRPNVATIPSENRQPPASPPSLIPTMTMMISDCIFYRPSSCLGCDPLRIR